MATRNLSSSRNLIAVYGTLRRGGPANGHMKGTNFVCSDKINAKLFRVGWFPGIKETADPDALVTVDVYEIPPENERVLFERIDAYEGYRPGRPEESLFRREKMLLLDTNEEAFVYVFRPEVNGQDRIESGDWIADAYDTAED